MEREVVTIDESAQYYVSQEKNRGDFNQVFQKGPEIGHITDSLLGGGVSTYRIVTWRWAEQKQTHNQKDVSA